MSFVRKILTLHPNNNIYHHEQRLRNRVLPLQSEIKKAQEYAVKHKFDALTSVLGVSRYKDLQQVNNAARQAWINGVKPYLAINWRKGGLEELRRALVKELNLYVSTIRIIRQEVLFLMICSREL